MVGNILLSFFLVAPGLYRGPRPESIEQLRENIPSVNSILNLESGWYEEFHNDPYKEERKDLSRWHIVEINHEMSPLAAPGPKELETIADIIESHRKQGSLYVHCEEGKDRTGMAIAAWRIRYQGWSVLRAKEEMLKMGFHESRYFWWAYNLSMVTTK